MVNLNNFDVKDATHNLSCAHQYNSRSRAEYNMKCILLYLMPGDRAKVIVFGDRRNRLDYRDTANKKRIRYIDANRLTQIRASVKEEPNGKF